MLEGRKINLKPKVEEPSFKSSLNFETVKGTGIPASFNSNKLVQKIKDYGVARLVEGWKKGVVRNKPSDEDKALFKAIVVVLKYKHGVRLPKGMESI